MGRLASGAMFVVGGLAVAFVGAAGKDGWEYAKDYAKSYISSGGYDYVDTFTPGKRPSAKRADLDYGTATYFPDTIVNAYPDRIVDVYPDTIAPSHIDKASPTRR